MQCRASKRQIVGISGVIIYAGWLLSSILNPALSMYRSYVSEITVVGQPYFWLFRIFNTVGSSLILYLFIYIYRYTSDGYSIKKTQKFLLIGSTALFINSFFTMGCAPSLSLVCHQNFRNLQITVEQALHLMSAMTIFSSIIIAQYYYMRHVLKAESRKAIYWNGAHLATQVIASLSMAVLCLGDITGIGTVQRLSMLFMHVWLIGYILSLKTQLGTQKTIPVDL